MSGVAATIRGMGEKLSRKAISEAVDPLGWRFVLGVIRTCVRVPALVNAVDVAAAACREGAGGRLRLDLRETCVILTLQAQETVWVGDGEIDLAGRITAAVRAMGLRTEPDGVQQVEIAIDATDIASIRPFWKAILGYTDEPGNHGLTDPIVDPLGQHPAIWFQPMEAARLQRNRVHLDICVPADLAQQRIQAALAAGGIVRYDAEAPAFWVLTDVEGNEACITTWEGRDID